jgi:hypothetical protein
MVGIRADPWFENLHDELCFQAIADRMGLVK